MPRRTSKRFASAYQRIGWAEEHITELKKRMGMFFRSYDYERVSERDPKTGYMLDKLRLSDRLPDIMTRLTVQTIETLRSALDHAACAVVTGTTNKRATYFPFDRTKPEFEKLILRKCKHVPDEIRSVFRSFKPYKRGNPAPLGTQPYLQHPETSDNHSSWNSRKRHYDNRSAYRRVEAVLPPQMEWPKKRDHTYHGTRRRNISL